MIESRKPVSRPISRRWPGWLIVLVCTSAGAQEWPQNQFNGPGSPSSFWLRGEGSSTYVPFGAYGGFVPYTPGPGQGLGVMRRFDSGAAPMLRTPMGLMGPSQGLGAIRGSLTPLAPIGGAMMGTRGMGAPLVPRRSTREPMRGSMGRPPVGGYPFRIPPSLLDRGTSAPAMSM
jgi:hypothetical protein